MTDVSMDTLIEIAQKSFIMENAAGIETCIQLHLMGSSGGDWFMQIHDSQLGIQSGLAGASDANISLDTQDLMALIDGSLNPMRAYLGGRISVSGDQMMLLKLAPLFKISPEDMAKLRG